MSLDILRDYALSFSGTPYLWGGNSFNGIDCSGFVQIILKAAGEDPPGDQTAQALFNHYEKWGKQNSYGLGSLAFFGKSPTKISHIGFCLNQYQMIHAGGGNSKTKTVKDAIAQDAYVKVTLINYRKDLVAVIKPRYEKIGIL